MTNAIGVGELEVGPFALRMNALRGTATYAAYLAMPDDAELALTEIEEELRGFDPGAQITRITPQGAKELVAALADESDEYSSLMRGRSRPTTGRFSIDGAPRLRIEV